MADDNAQQTADADKPNPFGTQQRGGQGSPPAQQATSTASASDKDSGDDSGDGQSDTRAPAKSGLEADLARERRKRQDLERELTKVRDAEKSELQKAIERAERAEAAAKDAARYRAAAKAGLTDPDLIERLRGDDDDELLADAKALAAKVGRAGGQQPDPDQGRGGNGQRSSTSDMNAWMRQAAGRPT